METCSPLQSSLGELSRIAILVPAWQPEENLISLLEALEPSEFAAVVLIDDGSGAVSQQIFAYASTIAKVRVLRHAANLGKGRALKTGLNYVLAEMPDVEGVVSADADGQHAANDIIAVAGHLYRNGRPVLGTRTFGANVPFRSRFGNTLTRYLFWFLAGEKVSDTQSGLRGFPRNRLAELIQLAGEGYEYEMNVLAHLCRKGVVPEEVPIATIYLEQNRSSHFDPIRDSMRIYFVLARFYASSLISAGIDFAGFALALHFTDSLPTAVVVGRLSSIANYLLNRKYVFRSGTSVQGSLSRYYLLAIALTCISYGSIRGAVAFFGWNPYAAKIATETALSFASFALQRIFVFPSCNQS
jgi:glycosyltransferase involved in cell wall biosynthesis